MKGAVSLRRHHPSPTRGGAAATHDRPCQLSCCTPLLPPPTTTTTLRLSFIKLSKDHQHEHHSPPWRSRADRLTTPDTTSTAQSGPGHRGHRRPPARPAARPCIVHVVYMSLNDRTVQDTYSTLRNHFVICRRGSRGSAQNVTKHLTTLLRYYATLIYYINRSIPFLAVTRSEKSKDRGRWRPSCGLYGTWPSTTIVSATLTAVSGPCAPDN